jgi:hypothetical protein
MSAPKTHISRAGGAVIAFAIIAGTIIGGFEGQPSIGFLIGGGIGILISLALFLWDRRA